MTRADGRLLSAVMLGVASGSILVPLNSTMLAVALPGVMSEFGLGANTVSSLVTLYLGAVAVALPVGGSLGDRFGHRRTFLAGVAGFGAASLLAALASSFVVLEAARVLQAASGALISTSSAALIRETAPETRRGEAFGLFDLLVSTSAAIGPFVGGVVVGALGWRSLFFLAVPIAILAAVLVGIVLRPGRSGDSLERHVRDQVDAPAAEPTVEPPIQPVVEPVPTPRPIDIPGLVLLALVIVAFLLALRGESAGLLGTIGLIAVIPLAIAFLTVELRRAQPAVDPRLFLRRPFAAAVIGVFGATVVLHGCFILVPLLVENVLHETATTSGIVLLGIAGVSALVAPFGGRASDRIGRRRLAVTGSLITAVGLGLLWLPAGLASAASVAILLGVVGLGFGLAGSPRQAAAFETIEPSRLGMASGTYYTGRYLGGVVGASLAGAVLGQVVTAAGVSLGFGLLTIVAVIAAVTALGLPGPSRPSRLLPFR
ncbi:MAG: MFS transporter [Chloroflexota bacterium]